MWGFVAEQSGDLAGAERRYRQALAPTDEYIQGEGNISLRLADLLFNRGEIAESIEYYDVAVAQIFALDSPLTHQLAVNNRGVAHLRLVAESEGSVDCSGAGSENCTQSLMDFEAVLQSDPSNPMYLMNKAWVLRLMGDGESAAQLMARAIELDPSLYAVLVDMGVYAQQSGNSDAARDYFLDAVAANPDYDLGWWNLGVLKMKRGPVGIVRGQAYLARAIVVNPSLATSSLNFRTDESFYRVEITDDNQPGSSWSFSSASSLATTGFGLVAFVLVVFHASKDVFKDRVVEEIMNRTNKARAYFSANVSPHLQRFSKLKWSGTALLLATIAIMILAAMITAWRGDSSAAFGSVILAIFSVVLAVLTHEFGHRLSARMMNVELEAAQWTPGIGVSLLLLPFNLSSGPFPAQRAKSDDYTNALWVYLFGPLANLAMAILAYWVYSLQPVPLLRMVAIAQLAVMSYSLLPFDPLDGAALSKAQPRLVAVLAFVGLLFGVLFSRGIL